jgi:nicotinate phosphoribosyltransferase
VARALGERLRGVRLDTSEKMVDESLRRDPPKGIPEERLRGVNRYLCENVRCALDIEGFSHVRIVASGGMTPEKVADLKHVVDVFGVGSSLLRSGNDFTADIVLVDGRPQSKIGRVYRPNDRLVEIEK